MRTRQKCVATDTWRSLGCRTTSLEHWSRRKPTVEPRWAKQQTKKLRPKPTKINSFMSGLSNFTTTTTMANSSMLIVSFDGLQYIAFNSAIGQDFIDLISDGSITESNPNLNSISVPMETDTVDASGDHGSSEEYTVNELVAQRFPAYLQRQRASWLQNCH